MAEDWDDIEKQAPEEEPEEEIEDIQIMSYSGDAAVSATSVSNGPLAL